MCAIEPNRVRHIGTAFPRFAKTQSLELDDRSMREMVVAHDDVDIVVANTGPAKTVNHELARPQHTQRRRLEIAVAMRFGSAANDPDRRMAAVPGTVGGRNDDATRPV